MSNQEEASPGRGASQGAGALTSVTVDIEEMYRFDPKGMTPDITIVRYSNFGYIQVNQRDVHVDFLEMPGVKREGRMVVNGTRVYMTHAAAQRLAEALIRALERIDRNGTIERYGRPKSEKPPRKQGK